MELKDMTEKDVKDLQRVTRHFVKKWRNRIPKSMAIEDAISELTLIILAGLKRWKEGMGTTRFTWMYNMAQMGMRRVVEIGLKNGLNGRGRAPKDAPRNTLGLLIHPSVMCESDYISMMSRNAENENRSLGEFVMDHRSNGPQMEELVERKLSKPQAMVEWNSITKREKEIIQQRLEQQMTYNQIGKIHGISKERARQILKRAIVKISGKEDPKQTKEKLAAYKKRYRAERKSILLEQAS